MYYIREKIEPIHNYYNKWIDGLFLSELLQFKGSKLASSDYNHKVFQSQHHEIISKYDKTLDCIRQPRYITFFWDNIHRILLGNAIERLITTQQAHSTLKISKGSPGTVSHTFTQMCHEGIYKGCFKGIILSFLQFSFVLFPSVFIANQEGGSNPLLKMLMTYSFFDALLYPLDTLKNILYSDTFSHYNIRTLMNKCSFLSLYRGIAFKMIFNLPVVSGIYFTSQFDKSVQAMTSWMLASLLYPLNTFRIRHQLSLTEISILQNSHKVIYQGSYRGLGTFLALNILMGWSLRPLFNAKTMQNLKKTVQQEEQHWLNPS